MYKLTNKWWALGICLVFLWGLQACGSSSSDTSGDTQNTNDMVTGDSNIINDTNVVKPDTTGGNDVLILSDFTINTDLNTPIDTNQPGTDLACYRILICINKNQCQTLSCQQNCQNQGSTDGKAKFIALIQCQGANCSGITDQNAMATCMADKCNTETLACSVPAKTGTKSCQEINGCLSGCGASDLECYYNCLESATKAAQDAYTAVDECGGKNCSSETTNEGYTKCVNDKCKTEVTACLSN